jgi:hypothetical protein
VHFYQKRMKRGGVGQMNSEEKAETQKWREEENSSHKSDEGWINEWVSGWVNDGEQIRRVDKREKGRTEQICSSSFAADEFALAYNTYFLLSEVCVSLSRSQKPNSNYFLSAEEKDEFHPRSD